MENLTDPSVDFLDVRRLASSSAPSWYPLIPSSQVGRKHSVLQIRDSKIGICRGEDGRVTATGTTRDLNLVERYGLVWLWDGSPNPLFDLPVIFELEEAGFGGWASPFVHTSRMKIGRTPVSRMLEQVFDTVHHTELHNLPGTVRLTVLDEPLWERRDPRRPSHSDQGAWIGTVTEIDIKRYVALEKTASLLRIPMDSIRLVTDFWPSGFVGRLFLGGHHYFTLMVTVNPYERVGYFTNITMRSSGPLRTLLYHVLFAAQIRMMARQDLPVIQSLRPESGGVLVKDDSPIIKFRRWYANWIISADAAQVVPSSEIA
jgi:hypothetical protein